MYDLVNELALINVQARMSAAATGGTVVLELTEDLDHWFSYGIFSADALNEYLDACAAYDWKDDLYYEQERWYEEQEAWYAENFGAEEAEYDVLTAPLTAYEAMALNAGYEV